MHYNNTNSDDMNEYETLNDQLPFVDYDSHGLWMFGIMTPDHNSPDGIGCGMTVLQTIDRDSDLNKLVKRAVSEWGVEPNELWISPCARELAVMALRGMKIGE